MNCQRWGRAVTCRWWSEANGILAHSSLMDKSNFAIAKLLFPMYDLNFRTTFHEERIAVEVYLLFPSPTLYKYNSYT